MKFHNIFTTAVIILVIIACLLPDLMEIRAIAIQDFSIVWFILFSVVFFTIWFYFLDRANDNLTKQIFIIIVGMLVLAAIMFLILKF
ncbi:hypothetical protein IJ707_03045 [bacterium]|nr:hypothetical protein [bacterium]